MGVYRGTRPARKPHQLLMGRVADLACRPVRVWCQQGFCLDIPQGVGGIDAERAPRRIQRIALASTRTFVLLGGWLEPDASSPIIGSATQHVTRNASSRP